MKKRQAAGAPICAVQRHSVNSGHYPVRLLTTLELLGEARSQGKEAVLMGNVWVDVFI